MLFKATLQPNTPGGVPSAVSIEAESLNQASEKLWAAFPEHQVCNVAQIRLRPQQVIQVKGDGTFVCEKKPARLWTILVQGEVVLPFFPVHHANAFLEDETHDWSWKDGTIRYYSRVADPEEGPVRVLVEY